MNYELPNPVVEIDRIADIAKNAISAQAVQRTRNLRHPGGESRRNADMAKHATSAPAAPAG